MTDTDTAREIVEIAASYPHDLGIYYMDATGWHAKECRRCRLERLAERFAAVSSVSGTPPESSREEHPAAPDEETAPCECDAPRCERDGCQDKATP